MKLTIALAILLLTSGCVSKQRLKIIRADIKRSDIKPVVWCDIRIEEGMSNRCRCRCFDLDAYKTVEETKCDTEEFTFIADNYPLEVCSGIGGTYLEVWNTDIAPNIKRLAKIKKKYL